MASWLRNHVGGIKEKESWRRNLGGEIMEEESWKRNLGEGFMEEESWRRNHGGGIMKESWSRNHLGCIWKAPGGGIWGIPGKLWGELWEARVTTGGPEALWRKKLSKP